MFVRIQGILMYKISDNIYNRHLGREEAKLKLWRYAGLMMTYRCPAACEFCYYKCSPEKAGLMPIETALSAWESLRVLAGENAKVHITGGEPFLYFDHVLEILDEAQKRKLGPLDSIETNGYWATDRKIVEERLRLLDSAGLERLKISWDPFHAEYIDIECVRRLAEIAEEIMGSQRVFIRWAKYLNEPVRMKGEVLEERIKGYRSAVADYPCRFMGRGAGELADLFANSPVESLRGQNCKSAFLSSKGVHIDPYGNVFSGLCSGIIIGNVEERPLEKIWAEFNPSKMELISQLFDGGPTGVAEKMGNNRYTTKAMYAEKCHFCNDLRQFLFDNGEYKRIIGPCDCYI